MIKSYFSVMVVLFTAFCTASQKTGSTSDTTSRTPTPPSQTPPKTPEHVHVAESTPDETRSHREELRRQVRTQGPEKTLDSYLTL